MILNWFPQWGFFTLVQLCREAKALCSYMCAPLELIGTAIKFSGRPFFLFGSLQNRSSLQLLSQLHLIRLKLANDTSKHLDVDMRDKLHSGKHLKGFFGDLSTCTHD